MNISIDNLANEIVTAVKEYTEDVTEAIEKEVDQSANSMLKETKANAPRSKGKRTSGNYAKGFKIKKEDHPGVVQRIMWNQKHPSRVHLLEFGHAKVNGGRVEGKPHIRPAFQNNAADLPDKIKRIIRNGG